MNKNHAIVIPYFVTPKYENLGKKTFITLTTQFIVIHILNLRMVLSTCEPFFFARTLAFECHLA
jgi:hypothetical protein